MPTGLIVIDGGAGTGKSTVCKILAQRLGVPYFNAGLIYRAIALCCSRQGLDPAEVAAERLAEEVASLEIKFVELETRIFHFGKDVTDFLKATAVSETVPKVAVRRDLRTNLTDLQRQTAKQACELWGGLVADGRDATSVVWPDAPYRYLFLAETDGEVRDFDTNRRNQADSRHSDFATSREGVTTIRTSPRNLDEVAEQILRHVRLHL